MDLGLSEQELEETKARILEDLRTTVRRSFVEVTAQCLGSQNVTILAALGVDAEATLLHIFLSEAELLFNPPEEGSDAR